MPSINDWATKAAQRILLEYKHKSPHWLGNSEEKVATIIATFAEPLVKLLWESRQEHDDDDCPMAHPDYVYNSGEPCTCGADAWNARVDDALDGN